MSDVAGDRPLDPAEELAAARHALSLDLLQDDLRAAGLRTHLDEPDDRTALLLIDLGTDDEDRRRIAVAAFVPGTGSPSLDEVDLLQITLRAPYTAPAAVLADVRQGVAIVNLHVGTGHFEVDDDGTVQFRHVHAVPTTAPIDGATVTALVLLLHDQALHFGDYVEGLCIGEVALDVLADVIALAH